MDQRTIDLMFALFRSAINGQEITEQEKTLYSEEMFTQLVKISKKHDILHLLVRGLEKNGLLPQEHKDLSNEIFKAVYRYQRLKHELSKLCAAFEKAEIPFMPLKGSVLREYYPEPWMRTSCDIDVLIHEEDLEKAVSVLEKDCQCRYESKGSHDVSMFAANGIHMELHYKLVEDGVANESVKVLETVWDAAEINNNYNYYYGMPDEMFYFYHIAHMAKHFENGGCGIRPFIDLWILDQMEGTDFKKREELLRQGNLLKFAETAQKVSRVWFMGERHDQVSRQMENYILRGGVYGTLENRITVQQQKRGGRLNYAFSKIFIPYEVLKFYYPILQKYPWLTPAMEVRRWGKLIFRGHIRRSVRELKYNTNISKAEAEGTKKFLEEIGL